MEQVKFLGYLVTANGIQPLPEKVKSMKDFPKPTTIKQMRQFMGIINFHRKFIPGAAKYQAELNEILKNPKTKEQTLVH